MPQLNLPDLQELDQCQNILITGIGGGFDILCGLPLFFALEERGKNVFLANYSFTNFADAKACSKPIEIVPDLLMQATPTLESHCEYYPEGYLAHWFQNTLKRDVPIYMFAKTGVVPLKESYIKLVNELKIDGMILVDGGVDSLMHGDEQGAGTLLEDSVSLAALSSFSIPKVLACLGFGTEVEDKVCHHHVLQNMAELIAEHPANFMGSCCLAPWQAEFVRYKDAAHYVQSRPNCKVSHITSRIVPAVQGKFGNYHAYQHFKETKLYLTPLMGLYWFFRANAVIQKNLLIDSLKKTFTFTDVRIVFRQLLYDKKFDQRQIQPVQLT